MAFIPIGACSNGGQEEIIASIDDPKIEETFLATWIDMNIQDSTFEFGIFSPGTYDTEYTNGIFIQGLFFNVKITGTIKEERSLSFSPIIEFRLLKYKDQEDLGIEIGDRVEISAPLFTTRPPAGTTWGILDESGRLDMDGVAFSLTLKVYD